MIELIRLGLYMIISAQAAYFIVIILLYDLMMDWYEWGTFPDPRNIFEKTVNILTALIFGLSYWAGLRVKKRNWFMKRVYLVGYFILFIILATITYKLINIVLKYIEQL
ncbi:hypothetical protein A374_04719 [Fictibacillus macauensis ZFHKF-1]|uniref:Uncharacterized protein n=1 Tax=Fictibacillus macauensis ZFHKF-1 TaxID=1196324 RepID=I8UJ37_9BACL|nr:hypothetical protein [Fictibacillus macauensis]EIT86848.1 hypothetical protein A374_04719 [Fictibacillus macauensis ZFHKF-1]